MKKVLSVIVSAMAGIALAGIAFAAEPPSTTVHSPDVQRDATMTGGNDAGANPVGVDKTHKHKKHHKKSKKSDQETTGAHGTGTGHGMGTGGTGGEMSGQDQEGVQNQVQPYTDRSQSPQPYSHTPDQGRPEKSGY